MNPLLFCLAFLLCPPSSESALPYIKRFESLYRQKRMMKATFLETYTENGRVARKEAGVAYFLRPGKMRWEYQIPEKNLFISDGKYVWFYVPADHTVTRVPARQSTDWRTPFVFLAGEIKLSRLCAHVEITGDDQAKTADDVLLSCELRGARAEDKSVSQQDSQQPAPMVVLLEIARSSGKLARVVVQAAGGVIIEFEFTDWRMDAPTPTHESLFHFSPPPGVAIVDGFTPERRP